jgi:ribonucleoside-diphosphate reductase alpha chain
METINIQQKTTKRPSMKVLKRDGRTENVSFDKIMLRLKNICEDADLDLDYMSLSQKVIAFITDGIRTTELDEEAARLSQNLASTDPAYGVLASHILISNNHKNTTSIFSAVLENQYHHQDKDGNPAPLISDEIWEIVSSNKEFLNEIIDYTRDFRVDYFGFKTLERAYLQKINDRVVERPQHMWLRVALGIHGSDMTAVRETYDMMSLGYFTHATPTLFNAGTPRPQMASCFLLGTEDSMPDIYKTIYDCAQISKWAGGIGVHISNIRATDSRIRGTNGQSSGIVPMLRVYEATAEYVNQGGRRKGSFALYLEPWHPDIFDFLELRKNIGDEKRRTRELFTALFVPDLFMERVAANQMWTLMCPDECPGLQDAYGDEFKTLYEKYEAEGKYRRQVPALDILKAAAVSQAETGTPYMVYKDASNEKSNQKNIGTIKSSNLCSEILLYSDNKEYATCNLASIALPRFVRETKDGSGSLEFDHQKLYEVTKVIARNINKVIDRTYYPVPETKLSNLKHRPLGIGVQGLADVYFKMKLPFDSPGAHKLNKEIFETIYFASLTASNELSAVEGPYSSYEGSPISQGIFQYQMWGLTDEDVSSVSNGRWDWGSLREKIVENGVRNSTLLALMPTASTSQILGNTECFEIPTSNIFLRRTLAGEFKIVNKYLIKDLQNLGLWSKALKNQLIAHEGSIQDIPGIPDDIKAVYKTAWEVSQKTIIDQSADRGAFIDQSQSLNIHLEDASISKICSMHMYAWRAGLKTGMYYLRTRTGTAVKVSLAADTVSGGKTSLAADTVSGGTSVSQGESEPEEAGEQDPDEPEMSEALVCRMEDGCIMCGS